jgi:acyl-CoA thioester hydrolase
LNDTSRLTSLPRREDFAQHFEIAVRFNDIDMNGHVNNAVFGTYFEAGRVGIMRLKMSAQKPETMGWIVARVAINYLAEVKWPGTVEIATSVVRLGRSSITFNHALFYEGRCAATGESINVLIDRATRRPTDIPQSLRDGFAPFMRANS